MPLNARIKHAHGAGTQQRDHRLDLVDQVVFRLSRAAQQHEAHVLVRQLGELLRKAQRR